MPTSAQSSDTERWGQRVIQKEAGQDPRSGGQGTQTRGGGQRGSHRSHSLSQTESERSPRADRPAAGRTEEAERWLDGQGGRRGEKALAPTGTLVHTTRGGWPPRRCSSRKASSSSWLCNKGASRAPVHPTACSSLLKHTWPPLPSVLLARGGHQRGTPPSPALPVGTEAAPTQTARLGAVLWQSCGQGWPLLAAGQYCPPGGRPPEGRRCSQEATGKPEAHSSPGV